MSKSKQNSLNPSELVTFLPSGKTVKIGGHPTLLDVALSGAVAIDHVCGGMGSCGTCRLFVNSTPEPLLDRSEVEQEMATARGFAPNERLACQTVPFKGMVVRVPTSRKAK